MRKQKKTICKGVSKFFKTSSEFSLAKSENNWPKTNKGSVRGKGKKPSADCKEGLYFYSPTLNSTRIRRVGEWLSAPLQFENKTICTVKPVLNSHLSLTAICVPKKHLEVVYNLVCFYHFCFFSGILLKNKIKYTTTTTTTTKAHTHTSKTSYLYADISVGQQRRLLHGLCLVFLHLALGFLRVRQSLKQSNIPLRYLLTFR
jgi:hypothetical protein